MAASVPNVIPGSNVTPTVTNNLTDSARFAFATVAGTTTGRFVHSSLPGKLSGMPLLISAIAPARRS